ncbi:MAG: hypothetical protein HYX53_15605 [Chloroflexi bacterium]|nr:hypothetical protein [Chloroflexota bacterium]
MPRWPYRIFLLFAFVSIFAATAAANHANAATTRVWLGAVDSKWSTPGNWSPSGAPVNGDSIQFTSTALGKTLTNDLVELTVAAVTFDTSMTIVGNRLGVSSSIVSSGANDIVIDLPLILRGDVQMIAPTNTRFFLRQRLTPLGAVAIDLNGNTLTTTGGGQAEVDGDLIGGGRIQASTKYLSYLVPVTYAGTVSGGPNTEFLLTVLGNGTGFCGSAPNTKFVLGGGQLTAACNVAVAGISGNGTVSMFSGDARLNITGQPGATFNGAFTGSAEFQSIRCCGSGSETLSGTSTFSRNFNVDGGVLAFDGAVFPAVSTFTVNGATLAGHGAWGDTILTTSRLNLERINGNHGLARFPALQFAPDVHVAFTIDGPQAGVDFTQILMSGQIVLDNAILELDFGNYSPPAGQAITLVKGATALLDTFKNLPEGAKFSVGNLNFKITYVGGAGGRDVVITSQGATATPTPTPTATPTPVPGSKPYKRYLPMVAFGL